MLDGCITLSLWSLPSEQGKRRLKLCQFKANYYHNFRFEPRRLISPSFNKRFLVQQTLQISVLSPMSLLEQGKLCISSGITEWWINQLRLAKFQVFTAVVLKFKFPVILCSVDWYILTDVLKDHSGFICSFRQPKKCIRVVEVKLLACLALKVNAGNTIFRKVGQYLPACTA
jgi:hypothetical protein